MTSWLGSTCPVPLPQGPCGLDIVAESERTFSCAGEHKGLRKSKFAQPTRGALQIAGAALLPTDDAPAEARWPMPLADSALHGLVGRAVREIEVYSEADQAALLGHLLSGAGALIGPHVHAIAGDALHPARLNVAIVGETSKGRKGSAARPVERLLTMADESFRGRINEGLSSGEGLIWQVRDPIYKHERVNGKASAEVLVDPGVSDKRLWLVESEMASALRAVQRDGNTLSALVRRAWDTGQLGSLTKTSPARSTGAHIGITGHVTRDELLRYLDRSELANGFANRFLWLASKRGRILPDGERVPEDVLVPLASDFQIVLEWARAERVVRRDEDASAVWHRVYGPLSEGRAGMFGAATNRAEAQVLRLSVLYAALDCSDCIRAAHLIAALAVWKYADDSARWIFGDSVGDPTADAVLTALRRASDLSRDDLTNLFSRHLGRDRLDRALELLRRSGMAEFRREPTSGRPREVWFAL